MFPIFCDDASALDTPTPDRPPDRPPMFTILCDPDSTADAPICSEKLPADQQKKTVVPHRTMDDNKENCRPVSLALSNSRKFTFQKKITKEVASDYTKPLKYNASQQVEDKSRALRFHDTVQVKEIPSHRDYTRLERIRMWTCSRDGRMRGRRNHREMNYDGGRRTILDKAKEEDQFHRVQVAPGVWEGLHPSSAQRLWQVREVKSEAALMSYLKSVTKQTTITHEPAAKRACVGTAECGVKEFIAAWDWDNPFGEEVEALAENSVAVTGSPRDDKTACFVAWDNPFGDDIDI